MHAYKASLTSDMLARRSILEMLSTMTRLTSYVIIYWLVARLTSMDNINIMPSRRHQSILSHLLDQHPSDTES